jgi:hypothetical protein
VLYIADGSLNSRSLTQSHINSEDPTLIKAYLTAAQTYADESIGETGGEKSGGRRKDEAVLILMPRTRIICRVS